MQRLTRYSIRSLLVLVTLTCLVLGWYAANVRAYRAERAVLVGIEQIHGTIEVEIDSMGDPRGHALPAMGVVGHATLEPISPFGVHRLLGNYRNAFSRVTQLSLYIQTVDFRVFEMLQQFPYLSSVYVDGSHIPKADRERIARLLPNVTFDFYIMEVVDEQPEAGSGAEVEAKGKGVVLEEPFIIDPPSSDDNPFDFD